jgi:hypothetical protein
MIRHDNNRQLAHVGISDDGCAWCSHWPSRSAYGEKIIQQRRRHQPVSSFQGSDQRCKQKTSPCSRKTTPTIMLLSLSPRSTRASSLLPWSTLAQKSQSSHNSPRLPLTPHAPLALQHRNLARDCATILDGRFG